MERKLPVWLFLLTVIGFGMFLVIFSAAAVSVAKGGGQWAGSFGRTAYAVARAPRTARDALVELRDRVTGDFVGGKLGVQVRHADLSGFSPIAATDGSRPVPGMMMRADPQRMARGWRLLAGAATIDGGVDNVAVLLDPDLRVASVRRLGEIPVDGFTPREAFEKIVHGLDILSDGSIIFNFDGGASLQRFDACGERLWSVGGRFHHSVSASEDERSVWTLLHRPDEAEDDESKKQYFLNVDVETGRTLRDISLSQVINANRLIDPLGIREDHSNDIGRNTRNTSPGFWLRNPFHFNDIEPLSTAMAAAYPGMEAGDVVVSARSLNLVAVFDPETLVVRWWVQGAMQKQHDPDFNPDGWITIFNNRMGLDYSHIIAVNPADNARRIVLDGSRIDFYTRIQGKHMMLPTGGVAVASAQQGWAFETDANGDVVWEITNTDNGDTRRSYVLTNFIWLPEDALDPEIVTCIR